MSNFTVPNTFVGGTKARAEEVNENFNAVKDELNAKIDKNENGAAIVGTATESNHAVNKGQLENILTTALSTKADTELSNLTDNGNKKLQYVPYSFCDGKVDSSGEADLLNTTNTSKIVFKVDSSNPLTGILAGGKDFSRTSIPDLTCSGLSNGTYNLFVGTEGACIPLANTILRQKTAPTGVIETPWTQPVLTANGTLGGSSFAVSSSSEGYPAWQAFSGTNVWTSNWLGGNYVQNVTYTMYNPVALKMNRIGVQNSTYPTAGNITSGEVWYSDNGSSYTKSNNFTNTNYTASDIWYIPVTHTGAHKYWQLKNLKYASGQGVLVGEFMLDAAVVTGYTLTNSVWLDTSKIPYASKIYNGSSWVTHNYVPLPQTITVRSGAITAVNKSGNYNRNNYDEFTLLPDTNRVTSLTGGTSFTASVNGWICNGSYLIKPLLIGETFVPDTNSYKFYAMKGV